jgi:hypothetical protein
VPQAGRKESSFSLTNPTNEPVEIAKIESSCHCLEIELPKKVLSPSEQLSARVLLDLSGEAHFTGKLSIEVKGKTPGGATAFFVKWRVEVTRTES